MTRLGLVIPDDLWNESLHEALEHVRQAEAAGFHSVWKGEASGSNGLMFLSAAANATDTIKLGTAITNVYSRTPALLGMSAVTLDVLSGGRALLGIGVSTPPVVEEWHGLSYDRPLRRLREAIEIVNHVVQGGTIEYDGEIFDVGPYAMGLQGPREHIPVFNAAMGERNRRLTAEYADGWMPVFVPRSKLKGYIDELAAAAREYDRDPPTVAPWIPLAVADDPARAERRVRELLAQEMAMGYHRLLERDGYGAAATSARDRWRRGDRDGAAAAITPDILSEYAVYGTPSTCRQALTEFRSIGVDIPIIWPSFSATTDEYHRIIEALTD